MSKICKNCKNEIDSKAKFCPICRKKQGGLPKWAIVLIVIFAIIVLAMAFGGDTDDTNSTASSDSNTKNTEQVQEVVYNVGDTISTNKFDITITSIHESTEVGSQYFSEKAKEGAKFIIVDMKYSNKTSKVISNINLPSLSLYDTTTNVKYEDNGTATRYYKIYNDVDEIGYDDLAPGLTVYDSAVFEMSADLYQNHSWQLKISNISDDSVTVNVK